MNKLILATIAVAGLLLLNVLTLAQAQTTATQLTANFPASVDTGTIFTTTDNDTWQATSYGWLGSSSTVDQVWLYNSNGTYSMSNVRNGRAFSVTHLSTANVVQLTATFPASVDAGTVFTTTNNEIWMATSYGWLGSSSTVDQVWLYNNNGTYSISNVRNGRAISVTQLSTANVVQLTATFPANVDTGTIFTTTDNNTWQATSYGWLGSSSTTDQVWLYNNNGAYNMSNVRNGRAISVTPLSATSTTSSTTSSTSSTSITSATTTTTAPSTSTTTSASTTTTTAAPTTTTISASTTTSTTGTTTSTAATTTSTSSVTTTTLPGISLTQGWNLVGNGVEGSLDVAASFGDATKVTTVWKWVISGSTPDVNYPGWAFYAPSLADGGQAYAASKGYEFLTIIKAGEGFWINANAVFTAPFPAGTAIKSSSFLPGTGAHALPTGWNLIATGDSPTAEIFNSSLTSITATPPSPGSIAVNLTTLWAWEAFHQKWYFWAPALVNNGGLANYITNKGYLDFATMPTTPTGTLSPTTGFWVNVP